MMKNNLENDLKREMVKNLKRETEKYWIDSQGEVLIDNLLDRYICRGVKKLNGMSLLEAEIDYAQKEIDTKKNNIDVTPCRTLVLLVGLSLEPLLQSVYVYKPTRIVLILNEEGYPVQTQKGSYAIEEPLVFARHLSKAVQKMGTKGFIGKEPKIQPFLAQDKEVFKTLVTALHEEDDVVIDITGGKKSMVTSAFLYAAFSGARISYVDFDLYCVKNRRPYGYGCKIGELNNPYQDFSLREWEKIRVLYNSYQFKEALQILEGIEGSMTGKLPDSEGPLENLAGFFTFYDKWDSGDFRNAKKKAASLQQKIELDGSLKLPSIVNILGSEGNWYDFDDKTIAVKPEPIYGDLNKLKAYVYDEIARIERLIQYNEDYRSAFLRSGGVSEIIMLGRLLYLVKNQEEKDTLLRKLKDFTTPRAKNVIKVLVNPNKMQFTVSSSGGDIYVARLEKDEEIEICRTSAMNPWWQKTKMFKDGQKKGYAKFLDMRNEAAHKYFPVPKQWAEEGLKFVRANLEDFMENHLESQDREDYCCTALPWSELCKVCQLDVFLTPNLRRDEES